MVWDQPRDGLEGSTTAIIGARLGVVEMASIFRFLDGTSLRGALVVH
jgi:hypothetical protein